MCDYSCTNFTLLQITLLKVICFKNSKTLLSSTSTVPPVQSTDWITELLLLKFNKNHISTDCADSKWFSTKLFKDEVEIDKSVYSSCLLDWIDEENLLWHSTFIVHLQPHLWVSEKKSYHSSLGTHLPNLVVIWDTYRPICE